MADRQYDIRVFQRDQISSPALLRTGFFNASDEGVAITGAEKLRQRVQLKLLTARNSQRFAPANGCQFINDMKRGVWRTSADVVRSFAAAVVDIKRLLKAEDEAGTPDDERVKEILLDRVTVAEAGESVSLHLRVVSIAGETTADVASVNLLPKGV